MVIFQAPGGSPGYNQFETLDEAVAFVESLRNDQNVTNARMFALEEIKFELKPFFKVELQALNAGEAPAGAGEKAEAAESPAEAAEAPSEPATAPPLPPDEPAPAQAAEPPAEPAAAQTFGAFSEQEPAPEPAPAAPAPAPQPEPEPAPEQPARRGLFGR
jgi:hypothetical protein